MTEWQAIWDSEAKAYYYWNPKTNETTWDDPRGQEEGSAATKEPTTDTPSTTDKPSTTTTETPTIDPEYYKTKEYYDWYMAQMAHQVNQNASETYIQYRKSQYQDLAAQPIYDTSAHVSYAKDIKHMKMYFDVEKYQRERSAGTVKKEQKLTKKQVDQFKKYQKERKVKRLLERMGADK